MSLFDLQDVCIVIGSLATLYLPMVVDLIGIYVLKGPYCTLTMTNWFLKALSVIPRRSWGDVARRFTMIRWASGLKNYFHIIIISFGNCVDRSDRIGDRDYDEATPPSSRPTLSSTPRRSRPPLAPPPPPPPDFHVVGLVSITSTRRLCSYQNSSALLVQIDEGLVFPVVDLIKEDLPPRTLKCQIPCESGRSQAPRRQQVAGDCTSSFGLVGMTSFWISEEDSAVSCVSGSCV
ncbi:hypothetical protein F511_08146 [Dorcoceras hygrometricum]|uniref:Uncharacterized protein n=1 Tax=Dorcoceras hygrometricum TaxID=472368 RepID=A0A2Z7B525_9LAMI|nr:hypothetical protein F511_08146 [Dorcoceras hygrometricum]